MGGDEGSNQCSVVSGQLVEVVSIECSWTRRACWVWESRGSSLFESERALTPGSRLPDAESGSGLHAIHGSWWWGSGFESERGHKKEPGFLGPALWGICECALLQRGFNGFEDFGGVGFGFGFEAGEDFAVFADEELAEVPFHVAGEWGVGAAEGHVEGVLVFAFDDDFVEQRKGDAVFAGAEFLDVLVGAGFLAAEVVAGEGEDGEAVLFEGFVEGLELSVLLGVAALGGDVDDEHDFAFIRLQGGVLAFDVFQGDVVEAFGGEGGGRCESEGGEGGDDGAFHG